MYSELKLFLYLSVLLFTSGIGILIYQNIDTIGHIAILSLLLIVTAICFYFCFKKSVGFSYQETQFKNSVFDYLILAAVLLSIIFIGYLQFQYVEGGITQWFNKNLKDFEVYNYSNNYFINFFKQKDICKQDKFDFE